MNSKSYCTSWVCIYLVIHLLELMSEFISLPRERRTELRVLTVFLIGETRNYN